VCFQQGVDLTIFPLKYPWAFRGSVLEFILLVACA
jgi:hypothetical protein